jgi:hypothetical protein
MHWQPARTLPQHNAVLLQKLAIVLVASRHRPLKCDVTACCSAHSIPRLPPSASLRRTTLHHIMHTTLTPLSTDSSMDKHLWQQSGRPDDGDDDEASDEVTDPTVWLCAC